MLKVTINGNEKILKITDGVKSFLKKPRKALDEVGDFLLDEFQKNFKSEGTVLQSPWAALQTDTLAQKARLGFGSKGTLERTGKLRTGFEKTVLKSSVRVFNDVAYYRYHQLGEGDLPKRKMISTTKKMDKKIVKIISKHINDIINGKV